MKNQAIIFLFLIFSLLLSSVQSPVGKRDLEASVIPDDAIRLRILANSDTSEDQALKKDIRDSVRTEISSWVKNYRSFEKAHSVIKSHLPDIRNLVGAELEKAGLDIPFTVKLGNAAFPTKLYGSYIYPAGKYEAVVITLGKGLGSNWWCVLFPPLCFLDIDSGEAVKEEEEGDELPLDEEQEENEIEVKLFIVEWFTNLLSKWGFGSDLL